MLVGLLTSVLLDRTVGKGQVEKVAGLTWATRKQRSIYRSTAANTNEQSGDAGGDASERRRLLGDE